MKKFSKMDQVTWFRTKRGQVTWICKAVDQITWDVLFHWVRLPGTHVKAGLFMGRVRVRVLLPQALRRARRGGRHRLGVDTLDLLRAVGVHRQAVLAWLGSGSR